MKKIIHKFAATVLLLVFALAVSGCDTDAKGVVEPEVKEVNEGFVTVTDIDGLIAAIKPDAKLLLKSGRYELSSAESYGSSGGEYYEWRETYDGYELAILDADNLVIKGEDDDSVFLNARSTYANVLTIEGSDNVTLENLTVGHSAKPGTCSGGVLMLERDNECTVSDCKLYGCGIIGVDALECKRLTVVDCDIYQCPSSAVNANQCLDVRIIDCDIHDCGGEYGGSVFSMNGTAGFAAVNCEIENNNVNHLMYASYCPETYILGCEMKNNTFRSAAFWLAGSAPKVEGTSLHFNSFTAWYDSEYSPTPGLKCTDRAGNELKNSELENMQHSECSYDGPVITETAAQPKAELNSDGTRTVHANNVDEFLAAIAPDTVIFLDAEEMRLSDAANYGSGWGEYYRWEAGYDGPQLVIENCKGLSITSDKLTHVIADPRYANVLTFENCSDVDVRGIKAGHSEQPESCSGGVIYMNSCKNMSVSECMLYGCGVYGVCADYVEGLSVTGCEIYDCTQGAVFLYDVDNGALKNCIIHGCPVPEITLYECTGVSFVKSNGEGVYLTDGQYSLDENGLPFEWSWDTLEEDILPSLDEPYINVYIGNALSNTLFLGKNDGTAELSAYVIMPNGENVRTSQIIWVCENEKLELDKYNGQNVTLKSALEEGQAAELYIYYLNGGVSVASTSVSVFGSRPEVY